MGRIIENNNAKITGTIIDDFQFSHEAYGEKFYTSLIASKRASGVADYIPITVSNRLVDVKSEWRGQRVTINGSFRSYNKHTETGSHLILRFFVNEIALVGDDETDENCIHMEGYTCKEAVYRKTPLGREIADVLLAVNRIFNSDYIPCIFWGRDAKLAEALPVGTKISLDGRIQSREYNKRFADHTAETRVAYEVSANVVSVVEEREVEDETSET